MRIEYLEISDADGKKWYRSALGITLADRSVTYDFANLKRVTFPSAGYRTVFTEVTSKPKHSFIPDDDIFDAQGAYRDYLFWCKDPDAK